MVRLGAAVVAMEVVALVAVWLSQVPRRRLAQRRTARYTHDTPEDGGLMSGFFEVAGR